MGKDIDEFIELMNTEDEIERRRDFIAGSLREFAVDDGVPLDNLVLAIAAASQDAAFYAVQKYHEWVNS